MSFILTFTLPEWFKVVGENQTLRFLVLSSFSNEGCTAGRSRL